MKTYDFPTDYRPYIDKYFLRSKTILEKEGLNPTVKYQVFIRKGNTNIYGIDETLILLEHYANIHKVGKVWALPEGSHFENKETVMIIEAPIQSIIDLETMYLGIISGETTLRNDTDVTIDLNGIRDKMSKIVELVDGRPVYYFGARHHRYDFDYAISKACFFGGASDCSTDIGASAMDSAKLNWVKKTGVGTIPHALEAIYHWRYGVVRAVSMSTQAFDQYIDKDVPRIALVDYANWEQHDTILTARALGKNLAGVRIDTCGENRMEGDPVKTNRGVTVEGVVAFRDMLIRENLLHLKVVLSSGFGNPDKVQKFVGAEKELGYKIFDALGVGGVFDSRIATADIVEIEGQPFSKMGRPYVPNPKLVRVI